MADGDCAMSAAQSISASDVCPALELAPKPRALVSTTHTTSTLSSITFTVEKEYQPISLLGAGAYGSVCVALHNGQKVAIKKVAGVLGGPMVHLRLAQRAVREVMLLRHLQHENIIAIRHLMLSPDLRDVYIVTDLMDTDLHMVIQSQQALTDDHCQYFLYQMLCALRYIHSASVLHRDIKPANLLVNSECDLKLCDFGLSRQIDDDGNTELTSYVMTRWYRAPEVLLRARKYTTAVDMWSVGCIFAELITRTPLFAGRNLGEQLRKIIDCRGNRAMANLPDVHPQLASQVSAMPVGVEDGVKGRMLRDRCPQASAEALSLLEGLLQVDPSGRLTADVAMRHAYFEDIFEPSDAVATAEPFSQVDIEGADLDWAALRRVLNEEIAFYQSKRSSGDAGDSVARALCEPPSLPAVSRPSAEKLVAGQASASGSSGSNPCDVSRRTSRRPSRITGLGESFRASQPASGATASSGTTPGLEVAASAAAPASSPSTHAAPAPAQGPASADGPHVQDEPIGGKAAGKKGSAAAPEARTTALYRPGVAGPQFSPALETSGGTACACLLS